MDDGTTTDRCLVFGQGEGEQLLASVRETAHRMRSVSNQTHHLQQDIGRLIDCVALARVEAELHAFPSSSSGNPPPGQREPPPGGAA